MERTTALLQARALSIDDRRKVSSSHLGQHQCRTRAARANRSTAARTIPSSRGSSN